MPFRPPALRGLSAARLVLWCWRHGALVCVLAVLVAVPSLWLAGDRLELDTDETHMIASDVPYRQAEMRFDSAFPQTRDRLVAVIEAATPELAEQAAETLAVRLGSRPDLFHAAGRPPEDLFFRRFGLLFLSQAELEETADRLIHAQPLLGGLAADPSLRGLMAALDLMLTGAERGDIPLAEAVPAITALSRVGESVLAGRPRPLSWGALMTGGGQDAAMERRFVLTNPRLDHTRLMPGSTAAHAIRAAAKGLDARVRLTGPVALTGDNFRTVAEGAGLTAGLSLAAVGVLLLLGVGSLRLTAAILATLLVGLSVTAAFAAVAVGTLNPISVAFVALFIGLAVDFAIQFTIRYRDDHFHEADAGLAMRRCAHAIPRPLLVVAAAVAVGFLSFLPTDYVGVSQLGLIAGAGMAVGVLATLTVLPALLAVFKPQPEPAPPGFSSLAPLEIGLRRHAVPVLLLAVASVAASVVAAPRLRFDFDPLHLQDPTAESVSTFRDLARSPRTTPYVVNLLAVSAPMAKAMTARLAGRPEVAFTLSLSDFVPEGQRTKLPVIEDLRQLLGPSLYPALTEPLPSATGNRAAMAETAHRLEASGDESAIHLAKILRVLLDSGRADGFERAVTAGLSQFLEDIRTAIEAGPVTLETLPTALVRDWVGVQGQYRVEVHPAAMVTGAQSLRRFVEVTQAAGPDVSGPPVAIVESGKVVQGAFAQAGIAAVAAIIVLLGLVLRRPADMALVLAPLALGALLTVDALVLLGQSINFANIIALPLILGVGVAYNAYFVLNWRAGLKTMLTSATARAVLFSALTTGIAFGALALSPHRGTASLGLLLLLALLLMVVVSFLLLPAGFALLERRKGERR